MAVLAHLTTADTFEEAWPLLAPAVERRGAHTKASVWSAIRAGHARLWLGEASAMVCNIHNWPSGKRVANTWLLGGELPEIVAVMDPAARAWANENGCNLQFMDARPGWQKVLPDYRELARVIVRDLP